jgi:hypothetical protein
MVDAKAFLDQIMGQVYGWVKTAIPSGFDFSLAENADPIARHNIFVSYVKPRLSTEFREYRFNLITLLSNPLMTLPFRRSCAVRTVNTSQQVFEFNAKNKSVLPLAVDDESKALVSEVDRYSTTYAYLINNAKLMQESKPERYALIAANLNHVYDMLKDDVPKKPLADRILGVGLMAIGIDHLLNGHVSEAKDSFGSSQKALETAKKGVIGNIDLGIMYQAIEKELLLLNTLNHMLQTAEMDPKGDAMNTMASFERIVSISGEMETSCSPRWAPALRNEGRMDEIFNWVQTIRQAQKGTAGLSVLNGGGNVLFPFWLVDFPYSFKTGSLWMKKGVEVNEIVLVSAGFTTDDATLYNPALALTDVFGNFEGSDMMDSLTGKETAISNGESLKSIPRMVSTQNTSGRYVITPLSTKKEVTMFMEDYIASITRANSNVARKLKLSAPQIKGLIFVPGDIGQSGYSLNYNFGGVRPKNIGNLGRMSKAIV